MHSNPSTLEREGQEASSLHWLTESRSWDSGPGLKMGDTERKLCIGHRYDHSPGLNSTCQGVMLPACVTHEEVGTIEEKA